MAKNLEKDFYADVWEKKRTAYGIHKKNRTGKGAVRLPSDYLSNKERKALMENTVLTEDLSLPIPYTSFKKLSPKNKKTQLEIWGNVYGYSCNVISKILGVAHATGSKILTNAGLVEIFEEKRRELSADKTDKGKEKRRNQALLLREILGNTVSDAGVAVDAVSAPSGTPGMPETENSVEGRTEPPAVDVYKKDPVIIPKADSDKAGNLSMQISGRGDLIKMAMSAYLTQVDAKKSYVVQMTFCEL